MPTVPVLMQVQVADVGPRNRYDEVWSVDMIKRKSKEVTRGQQEAFKYFLSEFCDQCFIFSGCCISEGGSIPANNRSWNFILNRLL